ncbi:MAG: alpha/beta fold hydrolase [Candidatus Binatia bacterium]
MSQAFEPALRTGAKRLNSFRRGERSLRYGTIIPLDERERRGLELSSAAGSRTDETWTAASPSSKAGASGDRPEGHARFHIEHLTGLVSKDFAQSQRGRYFPGMHTEMDSRLSAPAVERIIKLAVDNQHRHFQFAETRSEVAIAGAEHHVIPGAGHACCLEDPAAFDEMCHGF